MKESISLPVLIVEDDRDTSENLRDILELDEYEVRLAASAKEAFQDPALESIGVILLDRNLPDGRAEELLPLLQARAPHAAIIIVTGFADLQSSIAALRLGAADYLLKPINPDELRVSLRRISERRQMQTAVQDREARLQAIHNAATDTIVTFDINGTIESANPAAIGTFCCKELVGQNIHRFVPDIMLASEQLRHEMSGVREGGGEFPLDVSVSELSLEGQRLYTAFMRDISELKQAQSKLLQSERLAAIGKAMAGLVHESRNALQRSQAGLERLARRVGTSPDAQELIQNIQRAQDDLHHLYEEVRQYAAPVRLQPKVASIDECMTEAWIHLKSGSADVSTELKIMPAAFDLSCQFDPFTMRQVFRNILENAIAANQNSGEIEANFAEQNFNGRPAISISIRDHGPGLSKVQQSRMFEEFYTTKTRGTGLGLPIARRIVEAHGGTIIAISAPGAGADIRITLPRSLS